MSNVKIPSFKFNESMALRSATLKDGTVEIKTISEEPVLIPRRRVYLITTECLNGSKGCAVQFGKDELAPWAIIAAGAKEYLPKI